MDTSAAPPPTHWPVRTTDLSPATQPLATRAHRLLLHRSPAHKKHPAPIAATTPSPDNRRQTDASSPVAPDGPGLAQPGDHPPALPARTETASAAPSAPAR